jgi:hypothetical protein
MHVRVALVDDLLDALADEPDDQIDDAPLVLAKRTVRRLVTLVVMVR